MDIHERDVTYRRRIARITTIVVASLAVLLIAAQRFTHYQFAPYVGWKGEMELLPEITIEPEAASAPAAPAPRRQPQPVRQNVVHEVAERSEFQTALPVTTGEPRPTQPDILDLQARGAALSEAAKAPRDVSYSNTFVILRAVKPKYPPHEQAAGIEGNVTVQLLVDEQGTVAEANVLSLVGPVSFQNSALDAVRLFEFQPPIENGYPTSMWIKFVIKFRINN